MNPRHVHFLLALLAGGLAGCETTSVSVSDPARQARITEYAADYAALPPAPQKEVGEANLNRGATFAMTYMILGTPDRVETSADGRETQWTYTKFYQEVKILNTPLFPARTKRDATKLQADRMDHLLLHGSGQTREEFARANTPGGYDTPKSPREFRDRDPAPPLPGAELELFFQDGRMIDVKVQRDYPLPPFVPGAAS